MYLLGKKDILMSYVLYVLAFSEQALFDYNTISHTFWCKNSSTTPVCRIVLKKTIVEHYLESRFCDMESATVALLATFSINETFNILVRGLMDSINRAPPVTTALLLVNFVSTIVAVHLVIKNPPLSPFSAELEKTVVLTIAVAYNCSIYKNHHRCLPCLTLLCCWLYLHECNSYRRHCSYKNHQPRKRCLRWLYSTVDYICMSVTHKETTTFSHLLCQLC